jgi:Zn ribbon nucleic-acid-binding protein
MTGEKCEHCLGLERIKTWKIGITELVICSECAEDIIKMHQEMSEWVGL